VLFKNGGRGLHVGAKGERDTMEKGDINFAEEDTFLLYHEEISLKLKRAVKGRKN